MITRSFPKTGPITLHMDHTHSEKTRVLYDRILRRYQEQLARQGFDDSAAGFAALITTATHDRAASTWRQHKAAIVDHLMRGHGAHEAEIFRSLTATALLPKTKPKRRLKTMPSNVLALLIAKLRQRPTPLKSFCSDLLIATVITGIRPAEWQSAHRDGNNLVVTNAKFIEGVRGNGPTRSMTLDPTMIEPHHVDAIDRLISVASDDFWSTHDRQIRATFRRALEYLIRAKLIPARYRALRIYDARHQFASDAKSNLDILSGDIPALMGHRSAMTSYRAYGRRKNAQNPTRVRPSLESVQAVSQASLDAVSKLLHPSKSGELNPGSTPSPPGPGQGQR